MLVALLLIWNSSLLNASKHSIFANLLGPSNINYVCAFIIFLTEILFTSFNNNTILISIFVSFLLLCCLQHLAVYFLILKPQQLSLSEIKAPSIYTETSQYFFKNGIGLLANSLSYIALGLISMLMIKWLTNNESALGHYFIVMKISSMSMISILALDFLINPYLSGLHDESRLKKIQNLINFNHLVNLVWLAICLSVFFSFKSMIFQAYDINFEYATSSITLLLIFNYVFFGMLIKAQNICIFNDQNKKLYLVSAFQLIFLAVLNMILIARFSYVGAIYATIISETIYGLICCLIMRAHHIKIKVFIVV